MLNLLSLTHTSFGWPLCGETWVDACSEKLDTHCYTSGFLLFLWLYCSDGCQNLACFQRFQTCMYFTCSNSPASSMATSARQSLQKLRTLGETGISFDFTDADVLIEFSLKQSGHLANIATARRTQALMENSLSWHR